MKPSLQLRTSQNLAMTPQLQQAIRLLQLSSMELQMEVQQALESNMMLELDEDDENNESSEHQFDDAAAVNVAADEEKSGIDADEEKSGIDADDIPEDLLESLGEDMDAEMDELEAVLHRVQAMEPAGVAARDLRECLLLQLEQCSLSTPHLAKAKKLVG